MMDITKLELTDEEILALVSESGWATHKMIVQAQLAKALWGILEIIEGTDAVCSGEFPTGYFVEEVSKALEAAGIPRPLVQPPPLLDALQDSPDIY